MIRRITSLALGLAFTFAAAGALAQEEGGDKPAEGGGEEAAKPAEGGGEAKAGGEASASAAVSGMPESKGAFGKSGQIAISSDFDLGFHLITLKPPKGDSVKVTEISFAPALDYFVADSISIGAQLRYTSSKSDQSGAEAETELGVMPRVGYNLGLSDNISFWPKLGFYYASHKPPVKDAKSNNRMGIDVHAPILFHPAPHFFIGLGPDFLMDISSKTDGNDDAKVMSFGVSSVVGGWF